mgnify:CR=1 FL=1
MFAHHIDSQSPWEQGRTERAGGSLKEDLEKIVAECAVTTEEEFELALAQALDVRNRYANRSGFSAHQRVFGSSLRLLGSLVSDDFVDRFALSEDPSTEFRRSAEIRAAAQDAYFKNADKGAVNRAARGRSRVPPRDIQEGQIVYVWRNSQRSKIRGWVGPGLVVCKHHNQHSVWVSMRGVLVKCNRDRVRPATDEEWFGCRID